ncbi:MAG: hypothetical protein QE487_09160 [Fluviicola sp.]|nr:hypothetical protein [Fluviicola sp.]
MQKNIIIILISTIMVACGNDNSSNANKNIPNLDLLTGLSWYERVLETNNLINTNTKNPIPENLTHYLQSIDSNFRLASDGEIWRSGCTPILIVDTNNTVARRDEKTGKIWLTSSYIEVDAPTRKLVYFGQNEKMAALIYMSGGIGVMQHLFLFKLKKGKIVEYWHGNTNGDISTQKEILKKIKNKELEEISSYI